MSPWNGSGTFGLSDTVTANTDATADETNAILTDLANGVNNAIAKDGQNAMSAPLKLAAGSDSNPSLTFNSDPDTGMYRKSGNTIGISVGGSDAAVIDEDGIDVPTGKIREKGFSLIPAGLGPLPFAGSVAPDGWLLCDGSAVSRTTYADLFDAIGTTYGNGDGSSTFNLPDVKGRAVFGKDDMGGSAANRLTNKPGGINGASLGAVGGGEQFTIAKTNLPTLGLTVNITDPGHKHTMKGSANSSTVGSNIAGDSTADNSGGHETATATTGISAVIPEIGGDTPINIVPPGIVTNMIIKY